jgi:hypothetical protein
MCQENNFKKNLWRYMWGVLFVQNQRGMADGRVCRAQQPSALCPELNKYGKITIFLSVSWIMSPLKS